MAQFEYVPVIQDLSKCRIQISRCNNFSTKTSAKSTGGGRLYGTLNYDSEDVDNPVIVTFYNTPTRAGVAADIVVARKVQPIDSVGSLAWVLADAGDAAENEEEIYYRVLEFPGSAGGAFITANFVAIPTFALDGDVYPDTQDMDYQGAMPGYDSTFGLRTFHAQAMREILTSELPARIPALFGGLGLAAFVSLDETDTDIPDLRKLVNADALRVAQGALVKALSAEVNEHQAEWREIATAARLRFSRIMDDIQAANALDEEDAVETRPEPPTTGGLGFGSFTRG